MQTATAQPDKTVFLDGFPFPVGIACITMLASVTVR
jgi:hypothetical protein